MRHIIDLIIRHPNFYHAKEEIKALGEKWQPDERDWLMPGQEAYNKALTACDNVDEELDRRSLYYLSEDYSAGEIFKPGILKCFEFQLAANNFDVLIEGKMNADKDCIFI